VNAPDPSSLASGLARLSVRVAGGPFPKDAIEVLGGWEWITLNAPSLVGEPTLPLLSRLVARDTGTVPRDLASPAVMAVVDTILATRQPALFRDSLDAVLASGGATGIGGDHIASGLYAVVERFLK
jgi:hypothetical protein